MMHWKNYKHPLKNKQTTRNYSQESPTSQAYYGCQSNLYLKSHTPRAKLNMGKRSTHKTFSLKLKTSTKRDTSMKMIRSPRRACIT
jgi:hypothetical protein